MIYSRARVRVLAFFTPICATRLGVVAWSGRPTRVDHKRKATNE